jgi:tetratricopeptide (TPR) repeat protein
MRARKIAQECQARSTILSRENGGFGMRTLIALSTLVLVITAPPALAQMGGGMGMSSSSSGPSPQQAYAAGVAAYNAHDYAESIRQLRSARSAAPNNGSINYALGLAYIGAGQKLDAREALTRAVRDRNAAPGAYLQLGLVSLELGDRAAAAAQQTAVQQQLSRCDAACGDAKHAQWQAAYDQLTQALATLS